MYDLEMETYCCMGEWIDKNNRPLLCELEGGVVILLGKEALFPRYR
jgi:hypothetical protein